MTRLFLRGRRFWSLFLPILTAPVVCFGWTFGVIGDTQGVNLEEPVSPVLDKVVESIASFQPDFVVHLGDKVAGTSEPNQLRIQFREYQQKIKKLACPVYEVAGNHDIPALAVKEVYQEEVSPQLYYSFNHRGSHFVILCSEMEPGPSGGLGQTQLDWLEKDLTVSEKAYFTFVFIHRPLYRGILHPYGLKDGKKLARILRSHRVTYLFCGHEHRFGICRRGGLIQYITGGGGAPLLNFSEESGGFYHYLLVQVEEGKVEVTPVKVDHPKVYQDPAYLWRAYWRLRRQTTGKKESDKI